MPVSSKVGRDRWRYVLGKPECGGARSAAAFGSPANGPPSRKPIHSGRRLEDALDQREVFWVLTFKDISPAAHVRACQLVGGTVLLAQLVSHLPETKVNPRVTERSRANHC